MTEAPCPDNLAAETLLQELVAIPSVTGAEAAAVRHLVEWMSGHGYDEAFVDEVGNAVGIRGQGANDLLLPRSHRYLPG